MSEVIGQRCQEECQKGCKEWVVVRQVRRVGSEGIGRMVVGVRRGEMSDQTNWNWCVG